MAITPLAAHTGNVSKILTGMQDYLMRKKARARHYVRSHDARGKLVNKGPAHFLPFTHT